MKLAIFDVDGTISDSQNHITHAMTLGFEAAGQPAPAAADVLQIVGLSLPIAVARLAPDLDAQTQSQIVEGYKQSYMSSRAASPAPLYPGAEALLRKLAARDDMLLAVATGKSRRGLNALIAHHGLEGIFVSQQVADDHPSKPHPSMIGAALSEAGVPATEAVMIGDTSFDIEMGRSAGIATIGVRWGYHAPDVLEAAGAHRMVDDFEALEAALFDLWEMSA
ncbi:HAD-IA family hydrolase [Thioclava atlantica]|uniref:Phosphoglycolate phosphatase n=1 Tax=Thioclava atlantica TaxID=1317124 RepID=A0A085TXW2_9RHOB|nr:HAD-IA family hydrolase [Thioclava atlantica]KFE35559.1 phosphoglycolate phosphatase [Thioclava atlantica]